MTTAQVVETSITVTNSSFQNYTHPDDPTRQIIDIHFRNYTKLVPKAWLPYDRPDRPDRPSRLKKCSSDRDDHMETLPGRSQTIANDPDDRDDRSRSGRS